MSNSWDVFCLVSFFLITIAVLTVCYDLIVSYFRGQLTGARFFNSAQEVRDDILRRCGGDASMRLSKNVKKGLLYSKEDVEFSEKYVMICHYERSETGGVKPLARFSAPEPTTYTPETIAAVFNVIPGVFPDHGEYLNDDPTDDDVGSYRVHPRATPAFIITHGAYLILQQAAPSLVPHVLYDIYRNKDLYAVDYGPVNGITGERYVYWPGLCSDSRSPNPNDTMKFWRRLLSQKDKDDEEVLYDAWKGQGNLWALVRPDRFPINETSVEEPSYTNESILPQTCSAILNLPLELLLLVCEYLHPKFIQCLMSTCKRLHLQKSDGVWL